MKRYPRYRTLNLLFAGSCDTTFFIQGLASFRKIPVSGPKAAPVPERVRRRSLLNRNFEKGIDG